MKLKSPHYSQITLVGQFINYEIKDGHKVKRMNLLTADGIVSVKLTKEARACLFRLSLETPLKSGALLSIAVTQKFDGDQVKYKAHDLQMLASSADDLRIELPPLGSADTSKRLKVKVCSKGSCRKRGALDVYDRLHREVHDRGLSEQIGLEKTGCLKDCKHGPNVKINQRCHGRVCPAQAVELMLSQV